MTTTKIWTSTAAGDDKFIAVINDIVYKGNPRPEHIEQIATELKQGNTTPPAGITGIPFAYIREINWQENKPFIQLQFGTDSEEQLHISDAAVREEFFSVFSTAVPAAKRTTIRYSRLRAGSKPLAAGAVLLALLLWTYPIAAGMEQGDVYEVEGQRYRSLAGIALALATLGTTRLLLLFGALLAIVLVAFVRKTRQPVVIHRIRRTG